MAGHSKWKNIQRRKNAQDAKRGKIFMKLAKEIYVAAKNGGGDPDTNPSLRLAIDKAKSNNMPNDNSERAIQKASGDQDNVHYEEITYEGYGPGGVAVMVHLLTDNKNRAAAEVRHAFTKNGGNLGEKGCVAFMFERKGILVIDRGHYEIDEEDMLLEAIEAGAEEIETSADTFVVYTTVDDFESVKTALEAKGFSFQAAELTMIAQSTTTPSDEDAQKMNDLIDALEDNDDVQEVYHNMETTG